MAYKTKWIKSGGCYEGGFRFRYIDGDEDWAVLKSVKYKYSRQLYEQMMRFKYDNEHDYDRCEYDCTGSSRVRITVKRKGRFLYMWYHWSLDV